MQKLFVLALYSLIIPMVFAQTGPDYPDPLGRGDLEEIIREAQIEGELPGCLKPAHLFKTPILFELHVETPGEKPIVQRIKLQSKSSRGEYLVIARLDEHNTVIFTDVIRHHFDSNLFHRWRIPADPKSPISFLFGDRFDPVLPSERRRMDRENNPIDLYLTWREFGIPSPGNQATFMTISDRFLDIPNVRKGHMSVSTQYRGGRWIRREFLKYDQVLEGPVATTPKKKEGMMSNFLNGIFNNEDQEKKPERHTFKDLNFSYAMPKPGYEVLDMSRINPDANLFFVNNRAQSGFIITTTNGTHGFSAIEQVLEVIRAQVASKMKITKEPENTIQTINGVPFTMKSIVGESPGRSSVYTTLCSMRNGYLIQLIFYQIGGTIETSQTEALELAKGYQFLDPKKVAEGAFLSKTTYLNSAMGIGFDPGPIQARFWNPQEMKMQFPAADYGFQLGLNQVMFIVPLDLNGLQPNDEILARALLVEAGVDLEKDILKTVPHTQGTAKGFHYEAQRNINGDTATYRIRVLRNGESACMLCSLGLGLKDGEIEKLIPPLDAVKLDSPLPFTKREESSKHRATDAMVINGIGLQFYLQGLYRDATPYFQRAHQIDEKNITFFNNLILAMKFDNRVGEAFKLYREKQESYPFSIELQSQEPHLLLGTGRKDEAAKSFKKLFEDGYRNEDDLLAYLNLLGGMDRSKEAVEAIDRFIQEHPGSGMRTRRWQHQAYAGDGRYKEALGMARKLAKELPQNKESQNDLITALLDANEQTEAIKLIDLMLVESPKDTFLHYQKGRAFQIGKKFQKAKEAYQEALAISPNETLLVEAIAQVSAMLGQGDQSAIRTKIESVPIPAPVEKAIAAIQHDESKTGFNFQVLRNTTSHHFKKNAPFKSTHYRTVKIFNRGGVEDYKTIRFSFDPTYQRAYINSIEVFDRNGEIVSKEDAIESYVSDTSAQDGAMGTTMSTVTATVPGLKPGSLLKFSYTIETKAPVDRIPYELKYFATTGASGSQAVILSGDLKNLGALHQNGDLEKITGDQFQAWLSKSVPSFYFEPLQPAFHKYLPFVAFGDREVTWATLGRNYLKELEDRLKPSDAITKLAKEVTGDLESEEARADAIMRYVQDQIVYQAIEFGRRARIPSMPDLIAANRYGDCKDHSLLARQLMAAVGIPAHLALVHTSAQVTATIPSLDQFDHMILYLPTIRGGTYFDGTGKQASVMRTSPISLAGQKALILDDTPDTLETIPFDTNFAHTLSSTRTIRPSLEKKEFLVQETLEFKGSVASAIRSYLLGSNEADWKSRLEQLLGAQSKLTILELKASHIEDSDKALGLTMTYTVNGTMKANGENIDAALPAIWESFYLTTNRSGSRRSPFEVSVPMKLTSHVTVDFPAENKLVLLLWAAKKSATAACRHTMTVEEARTLHSIIEIKRGIYPADQFQDYATGLSEAVESIESKVTLKAAN